MTSQAKVLEVERQVRAMLAGEQDAEFQCPFCGIGSTPGQHLLCCNEAAEVITAVLDHVDHIERCETVERTMDRFQAIRDKMANSSVLVN